MNKTGEVIIDGITYVKKSEQAKLATPKKNMPYVVIRTQNAGVHFGYLKSRKGTEAELCDSRRAWYWKGAASLSQMAIDGVKNPNECKFTMVVPKIELTQVIEVIHTTEEAMNNLKNVPVWKM